MPPKKEKNKDCVEYDHDLEVKNIYTSFQPIFEKYKQKNKTFKHPSRVLILGGSGAGKTNLATNIILDYFHWDTLNVFASNLEQEPIKFLMAALEEALTSEEMDKYIHFSTEIDKSVEDFDINLQNLVFFDDMASQSDKKNANQIVNYICKGRPRNISSIITSQGFYNVKPQIRENCNVILSFNQKRELDRESLRKYYCMDINKNIFNNIYNKSTNLSLNAEDKHKAFFSIFVDEPNLSRRYRHGFRSSSLVDAEGDLIENVSRNMPRYR